MFKNSMTHPKVRTANEVAKELAKQINDGFGNCDAIAQALTDYADERVKEHEEELICEDCGYAGSRVKPYLAEARAEALEEAAKVCYCFQPTLPDVIRCDCPGCIFAREIRALKVKS